MSLFADSTRLRGRLLYWARAAVVLLGATLLLGGHCHHHDDDDHYCHDDDDDWHDDDCDDDDTFIIITGEEQPTDPWRLQQYRLEVDPDDGDRHFLEIEGVSLFDALGADQYSLDDFASFARRVHELNRDVLGPPTPPGGEIARHGVQSADERLRVVFRQQRPEGGALEPHALLVFSFDFMGRLREIDDTTRDPGETLPGSTR